MSFSSRASRFSASSLASRQARLAMPESPSQGTRTATAQASPTGRPHPTACVDRTAHDRVPPPPVRRIVRIPRNWTVADYVGRPCEPRPSAITHSARSPQSSEAGDTTLSEPWKAAAAICNAWKAASSATAPGAIDTTPADTRYSSTSRQRPTFVPSIKIIRNQPVRSLAETLHPAPPTRSLESAPATDGLSNG